MYIIEISQINICDSVSFEYCAYISFSTLKVAIHDDWFIFRGTHQSPACEKW